MASQALRDQQERIIQVNRKELIDTLKKNRELHIQEYEIAKKGYRETLRKKIISSFDEAISSIEKKRLSMLSWAESLTDSEISKVNDHFTLLNGINLEMRVPRSYAKEYDAAIDIAVWDVRDVLELSYAEFQCFVRDEWDWKQEFQQTSALYSSHKG